LLWIYSYTTAGTYTRADISVFRGIGGKIVPG